MSIDQQTLKQVLVQLAGVTVMPKLSANPDLPDTWKSLTTKTVLASPIGEVQLLLAYGNVGDEVVACLSIGVPWSDFIGQYTSGFEPDQKVALDESVAGQAPKGAVVQSMYASAYFWLRNAVWDILLFLDNPEVKDKPLYLSGMGLGGPLAQIVALDFRPGNKDPNGNPTTWNTQPPSYVFSCGNFASSDFQTYFNQKMCDSSHNVRAGSQALQVDQYPSKPDTNQGTQEATFAPLGTVSYAPIATPSPYYTPWEVRDSNFYLEALDGTPAKFPASNTQIPNPPNGFNQTVAFSIAEFVADTYRYAFTPDAPAPGQLVKSLDFGTSQVMVAFFSASNSFTVSFRGSINYQEFLMMDANSTTAQTPYSESICSGVQQILYSSDGDDLTLAQQIRTQIEALKKDSQKLYLTGHGFGGALANAMAADLSLNIQDQGDSTTISPDAIYTYGATYFAGTNLAKKFAESYSDISYQILRPTDLVATALQSQPYWNSVDKQVVLLGALDTKENANHSLSSYLLLLNPERTLT